MGCVLFAYIFKEKRRGILQYQHTSVTTMQTKSQDSHDMKCQKAVSLEYILCVCAFLFQNKSGFRMW